MSTPIEQMILDAKRLANRLREKENLADELITHSTNCVRRRKSLNIYVFLNKPQINPFLVVHRITSWIRCVNFKMI